MQSEDEEMAEATNEARAEEDQGKDEDKREFFFAYFKVWSRKKQK